MKTLSIVISLILFIGCTQRQMNSPANGSASKDAKESFWKYLSKISNPSDTVREFSKYVSQTHNLTLETAYLRDRIFDSIVSPIKDTRKYYFIISTSSLSEMAMFDPKFNNNLCQRIKADPKEF